MTGAGRLAVRRATGYYGQPSGPKTLTDVIGPGGGTVRLAFARAG